MSGVREGERDKRPDRDRGSWGILGPIMSSNQDFILGFGERRKDHAVGFDHLQKETG